METPDNPEVAEIRGARRAMGAVFLRGFGIEVGAGSRPFPVPEGCTVSYGDVRDAGQLRHYFGQDVAPNGFIDAQTFGAIPPRSLDFVISAHVIEHLRDPLGSLAQAIDRLKPGGIHILVAPDKRFTFDRHRPETPFAHCERDYGDGGEATTRDAYREHLQFVHPFLTGKQLPTDEIERQSAIAAERWRDFDVHFHAWSYDGFAEFLTRGKDYAPYEIEAGMQVVNESIFVLRRR